MSLTTGVRVGSYEIIAPLGAGGMGEVYRARDTKLKRDVALKVLPEVFARDPERMARFQREAEVLASLNHPNIAQIYGVEENALVMELVEGENLKGPLPMDTALNYAKQIAEALEAAHEKGIIHRDLKPANVMITPGEVVKVLDFGLAAVLQGPTRTSDPAASPTLTMRSTEAGMVMGTAAYMSPEQASGKPVDKRADIWSFGVVLWEMLTGHRLFHGETISHTLADVLRGEIDFGKLPAETPVWIRELLRRCLDRNVKERLRDIGEARVVIGRGGTEVAPVAHLRRRSILPWALAGALLMALGVVAYRPASEDTRVLKFSVPLPEKAVFGGGVPAVSPDGRHLAVAVNVGGQSGLWLRDLDSLAGRTLPGTEGASLPFWSPDSRFLAFFTGGKLKKIAVAGGPAQTLCDAPNGSGGSWSKNDVIVFAPALFGGLSRVPAAGGTATPVTALEPGSGTYAHRAPWFLPDGPHFLYTTLNRDREKNRVYVADLDSKTEREVLAADSNVVFAPPGYLLFLRDRTLMAQPFDAGAARTTGDPVPIAEQVDFLSYSSLGLFSASQNGVLVYPSGAAGDVQLTWFDRSGKVAGTVGTPGFLGWPAISPDGATVAVDRQDPQTGFFDIWLHDLARGTASRFTFGPRSNQFPVWSPDGSHIAFTSSRDGGFNLYQKATSGPAQDEALDKYARSKYPNDWSRDARFIIETIFGDPKTGNGIWVLPLFGDRKPFPYLQTDFNERRAKLSPDGQWLAYASDESKRNEIYVQTFPTLGGKWHVSTNGGELPVWSRDGKDLFYIGADRKMMAVAVKGGSKFEAGVPKPLFDTRLGGTLPWFDVSKHGRFLIPTLKEQTGPVSLNVVVNWTAGLKK